MTKLLQPKKGNESIEVTGKTEMPSPRQWKAWNPIRMSNPKDARKTGNTNLQLFQRMTECRSIEVSDMHQTQIPQESKLCSEVQMSLSKDCGSS
jgi:hypothetical protein